MSREAFYSVYFHGTNLIRRSGHEFQKSLEVLEDPGGFGARARLAHHGVETVDTGGRGYCTDIWITSRYIS